MKKFIALFLLVFTVVLGVSAQSVDSIALNSGNWKTSVVAPGLIHKACHFTENSLFSSNQYISVLEILPDNGRKIEIYASPVLKETSLIAREKRALAAINGSFFKFNYTPNTIDYNSVDYIRKGFVQLAPNTYREKGKREQHQLGALAVLNDKLYILKADKLAIWEKYIFAEEVITTGPLLLKSGVEETMLNASFYTTRHPRTAIAIKKDGTILFITVDGRSAESAGVSLKELLNITKWLGAVDAINLDGGGSTTMFIEGSSESGVVNHPCDNKKFDNQGERKVANIVIVL